MEFSFARWSQAPTVMHLDWFIDARAPHHVVVGLSAAEKHNCSHCYRTHFSLYLFNSSTIYRLFPQLLEAALMNVTGTHRSECCVQVHVSDLKTDTILNSCGSNSPLLKPWIFGSKCNKSLRRKHRWYLWLCDQGLEIVPSTSWRQNHWSLALHSQTHQS